MKKTSLISLTVILSILLLGCENTQNVTPQTQATQSTQQTPATQEKTSGLRIYQVATDGTSQEITKQVGTKTQENKPTILAGTKGMAITDKGFTPDTFTIKVGTKVIFQNFDTKEHWPASDPHPEHTLCAGFDAKKGLAPKEMYEFTFTKAETCTFHDHLNPSLKGKIVVE